MENILKNIAFYLASHYSAVESWCDLRQGPEAEWNRANDR